ncbi:bifunctional 5,10-methylenetetrahydrofolate dehydrogenase/5,10-methenyltetrahydrofolate cyclohydrolase [Candidatus Kaiserbacteria bacterium]|nr:bifunctional 5,10-methylenetetrahydrofolate dehydrogenase/5,10-methenyltetrahydrofolate cyclohydrolase [Candidatus Kaiserbacteria bacterium]
MILNGREVASDMYAQLAERRKEHPGPIRLGIIVAGANPVIEQFVRIKTRAAGTLNIEMIRRNLPEDATTEDAILAVRTLSAEVDALIVQLPLPKQIDTNAVLSEIPHAQDVDVINPRHSGELMGIDAPVALAVVELLKRGGVDVRGKRTVVVGAGRLVGAPSAALLKKLGADVSMFTLEEGSIEDLKTADIVVLGAGKPAFVRPEHIQDGVAIIDAGASEDGGVVRGDADPACAGKASVFSPVPGGVGPVAVAMIFKNLFDLLEKK